MIRKGMSNIYLKVTIENKNCFSKLRFSKLGAPTQANIIGF